MGFETTSRHVSAQFFTILVLPAGSKKLAYWKLLPVRGKNFPVGEFFYFWRQSGVRGEKAKGRPAATSKPF